MPASVTDRMLHALVHDHERFQANWPIVAWLLRAALHSVTGAACLRCGETLGIDSLLFRNIPYCSPDCRAEARLYGDLSESAFARAEEKREKNRAYHAKRKAGHVPQKRLKRAA